jgi:hypothetical protein
MKTKQNKKDSRKCKFCKAPFVDNTFENYNDKGEWCCKNCWTKKALDFMNIMFSNINDINKVEKYVEDFENNKDK